MINKKKKNYIQFLKNFIKIKNETINKSVLQNNNIWFKYALFSLKKKKIIKGVSQINWKKNRFKKNINLTRWELSAFVNKNENNLFIKK